MRMKHNKLHIALVLVALALSACNKDHYDVSTVQGVNAEGELLLPVASASFTMDEMMRRFEIDSMITFGEDGNMSYGYCYEHHGAVKGSDLLRFKDWNYEHHLSVENPLSGQWFGYLDTIVNTSQVITFEADHIYVMSAVMRSGRFEFELESNVANLGQVVVTSSDITDADGNDLHFVYSPAMGQTGFDLAGLHYRTNEANTLTLNYEFHINLNGMMEPEIELNARIAATDLAIKEMSGYVEAYESRNRIDTSFNLFPNNFSGSLEINNARIRISERNTFDLAARLVVDTAMMYGQGVPSYSILDPLPYVVDLPSQTDFSEVSNHSLHGTLNTAGGQVMASSLFMVNPLGGTELVTVDEANQIDVRVDVDIPFAFVIDHVGYIDTVNMRLSEIELPDMIERLDLELTFNSTLPIDMYGKFYIYNSQNQQITDTLIRDGRLIAASFDGHATTTTLSLEVTEDRIQDVMHSDRIIMEYLLDTETHDMVLNANQKLDLFVKARAKYKGTF